jgi:CSLREA domain-containing protein
MDKETALVKAGKTVVPRVGSVAGLALVALALLAGPAHAATFTVNTPADGFDGTCNQLVAGGCTIRDALDDATSADSVSVPAGLYILNPQLGALALLGDKLNGAGARSTILAGNPGGARPE